ncbi:LCP family protein [Acidimicrobiia bacterium EGI L10123]|uniref:LCP family protein n=1 Tax=Salinilacustrithrix flava TaxID=2957203 RepID=UPI003D7C1EE1|nr:LCP family protein [Acidimicrobiia bacterium EGI L10123]
MSGKHLVAPRRRSLGQRAIIAAGALLTFVLLLSAAGASYLNVRFGQISRLDVAIDTADAGEPRNYLLVGSDTRDGLDPDDPADAQFFDDEGTFTEGTVQRTDTIMILRVDPEAGDAYLLSLPRDLWVPIADTGENNRINVAFSRGREVLVDTIRENFGIPIHHYVEVDLVGFRGLVEAIGGVPVYFSEAVRDDFSQLRVDSPGCVNLDGQQALAFARSRHLEIQDPDTGRWRTDPSGDLGRITRQQEFIRRAISKAVSKGLTNPVTLNELVGVGVEFVGLDPTLSASDIVSLGRRFASFDAESLQTFSVPAEPFRTAGGASVLDLDEREAERIFNIFRGLDPGELTPGLVEVTVLNGIGEPGLAGDVTAALDQIGFTTGTPGDTVEPETSTTIYHAPGDEGAAVLLARHVSGPVAFGLDEDLAPGEVVLVAGEDFTTLHEQPSPTVPELPSTTAATGGDGGTTSSTTTTQVGYVPEPPPGSGCA